MASKPGWRARAGLSIGLLMLAGAACADTGASAGRTTSIPPAEVPRSGSAPQEPVAPEPTGVPGLNSPDPFCAAWAAYLGTVQALSIAASFGDLPAEGFAVFELTAAPALVAAAAAIDASWPQQPQAVADERAAVTDNRIGPQARRAQHAVDALVAAGVSEPELDALRAAWGTALAERDPQFPVLYIAGIAADLQSKLAAAAAVYNSEVTPFAHDPSLTTGHVAAPETDAYLAANCPDLASSGVGDAL